MIEVKKGERRGERWGWTRGRERERERGRERDVVPWPMISNQWTFPTTLTQGILGALSLHFRHCGCVFKSHIFQSASQPAQRPHTHAWARTHTQTHIHKHTHTKKSKAYFILAHTHTLKRARLTLSYLIYSYQSKIFDLGQNHKQENTHSGSALNMLENNSSDNAR